ncbi:hypothetical protein BH24ACT15_BH24ACT15_19890 [soil metagenome]|jgi:hypothetical protein
MLGDSEEHRPYEDYAVRHVMGSLDEAESGTFRSHLLDCADCRARVGELRTIASDLVEVERSERRERAARLVETKEREDEPDEDLDDYAYGPSRGAKLLAVVGILLIIFLSVWNFVLRSHNSSLQAVASDLLESAQVINFGEAWTNDVLAPGHEGMARTENGQLAVLVRGTDDEAAYTITVYDSGSGLLKTEPVTSSDQVVRWFGGPLRAEVTSVEITQNRGSGDTIVFRALAE